MKISFDIMVNGFGCNLYNPCDVIIIQWHHGYWNSWFPRSKGWLKNSESRAMSSSMVCRGCCCAPSTSCDTSIWAWSMACVDSSVPLTWDSSVGVIEACPEVDASTGWQWWQVKAFWQEGQVATWLLEDTTGVSPRLAWPDVVGASPDNSNIRLDTSHPLHVTGPFPHTLQPVTTVSAFCKTID